MDLNQLIRKYSTAGPRYTSYPTAPVWRDQYGSDVYRRQLQSGFLGESKTLALYVHLPFCESLCYYCGCNIQITKDHSRSAPYVRKVSEEIRQVAKLIGGRRTLTQISWGGGTPTFLSVAEIEALHGATGEAFAIADDAEISIEIDPRVTTFEQLTTLRCLGFNRVSLGVQDFNEDVQKTIHRVQPAERTRAMLEECRQLGFRGINFDLIYGLPLQSLASFDRTISQILDMRPDRIALYNYARLPSLLPHQGILEKFPMPSPEERVDIFTMAYERLTQAGYFAIGMDHFALKTDELYQAMQDGRLYRNFMGYTVKKGTDMIGVGASAIGEVGEGFFQNIKKAKDYEEQVAKKGVATHRGWLLTDDDRRRKWIIQQLMCQFRLDFADYAARFGESFPERFADELAQLERFYNDGILEKEGGVIRVTSLGRLFIRNVAMVFDAYLKPQQQQRKTFSQTV